MTSENAKDTRLSYVLRLCRSALTASGWAEARERLELRRARLAIWIFRACGGRNAGLIPPGTTCSIPEIMGDPASCPNVVSISRVCRASIEAYIVPDGLPPVFRSEHAFSARNVYTMRDVIVGIPTGICLSDSRVFMESYGNPFRWFDGHVKGPRPKELALYRSVKPLPVEGPVTCFGSATYGHVLLQEVPKLLHALEERPESTVVTWLDAPRHVGSLLALLQARNVIKGRVVGLPRGLYRVDDYTFTSDEEDSGFFRRESVEMIRRYLGHDANAPAGPIAATPKKVYLSRRRSKRSPTNEADVEAMLSSRGFAIVYSEDLDMAEEIALFEQVDLIVGPCGAGLVNLVWVKPGTRVIEIVSPRMITDFFLRLATLVQAEHALCWARPDDLWGSVDLDYLASLVDRMEKHGERRAD
jgi:hypothetical protein